MEAEFAVLTVVVFGVLGFGVYRLARPGIRKPARYASPEPARLESRSEDELKVSYVPPEFEWSGTTSGTITLKTLTYKQYECLEDARNGFRILGLLPSEQRLPQAHKTRAHSLKTVASLSKHGFLDEDGTGGHLINDHGLHALEICTVRY